jgi:hypothetical protein
MPTTSCHFPKDNIKLTMTFQQEQQNRVATAPDAEQDEPELSYSPVVDYMYMTTYEDNLAGKDWWHILEIQQDADVSRILATPMRMMMTFTGDVLMPFILVVVLLLLEHVLFESIRVIGGICNRAVISIGAICLATLQGMFEFFLGHEQAERVEDALGYAHFVLSHHWLTAIVLSENREVDASAYVDRADFVKHIRYERIEMYD